MVTNWNPALGSFRYLKMLAFMYDRHGTLKAGTSYEGPSSSSFRAYRWILARQGIRLRSSARLSALPGTELGLSRFAQRTIGYRTAVRTDRLHSSRLRESAPAGYSMVLSRYDGPRQRYSAARQNSSLTLLLWLNSGSNHGGVTLILKGVSTR